MKKSLLLIDGNNFGFMAFGRTPLSFNGQRTEIISIGLNMIRRYLSTFAPDEVQIVYDGGRDVRRTEIFPDYKHRVSGKPLTEAEEREKICFFDQLRKFKKMLFDLGFAQWKCKGREADDVIYNVLKMVFDKNMFESAIIVSTDKDMFQLFRHFGDKVQVYSPIKDILWTKEKVEKELGIPIEFITFYRSMVGDGSDNLPGVKGIGPAKAKKIVEAALSNDPDVNGMKLLLFLGEHEEQQKLMQNLMEFKLIDNTELTEGFAGEFVTIPEKMERLVGICEEYGLQHFLENFASSSGPFQVYWAQTL